jgi:hypothetical protein
MNNLSDLDSELDKQVDKLVSLKYPEKIGISEEEFRSKAEFLRERFGEIEASEFDPENGYLPFVVVTKNESLSAEDAMRLVEKDGKKGIAKLKPHKSTDYSTIDSVKIPESQIYLLVGIERGEQYLNIRPEDALKDIQKRNRSPLTIDEGIAIVTQYPDFLKKNNCFSLLASRMGNQTVPAIWINGEKHPNLGWCWDRNPHTWLGSASCMNRI